MLNWRTSVLAALCGVLVACGDTGKTVQEPPTVTPPQPVASVEIAGARPINQGQVVQLTAVTRAANEAELGRAVQWTSADTTLATVSSSGLVTAIGRTGDAKITATSEGKSASVTIPVWYAYRSAAYSAVVSEARVVTVFDSTRGRSVSVLVWAAANAPRPRPVVLVPRSGLEVGGRWSSIIVEAGYAVVQAGTPVADERSCQQFGVPANECDAVLRDQFGPTGGAITGLVAAQEASVVRDNLAAISQAANADLDLSHVALFGVSRTAAASLSLAGATFDLSPSAKAVAVRDTRFQAVVANSPPGTGSTQPPCGCNASSWTGIPATMPVLVQTGPADEWGRREPFDVMPAGHKYLAYYEAPTMGHIAYTLAWSLMPVQPGPTGEFLPIIAIAFLDAYLKNNAEALAWLKSQEAARGTKGEVRVTSK